MPLKKDIVEIGEYVDELVKIVKVGNTMVILNGVKCVFNTDFYGLNHLISKHLPIL
jgi:shikimate 5-dehydrogenase